MDIFNGQHFGEFGLEMQEYTRANINNKKQKCIDYLTSKEYDTTYIKEGDILICKGDLSKKGYSMGDADFDTKDNPIIVLKEKDYYEMKKQSINNKIQTVISVANYYTDHIYLKYNIVDNNNNLPFALKFNITSTTQVIGNIAKGKKVKIQYEDLNVPIDELELKSIEVIEDQCYNLQLNAQNRQYNSKAYDIINIALIGVSLAMSICIVVTSVLKQIDMNNAITMLGI